MTQRAILVFDLDGTLFDHKPGEPVDYADPASLARATVAHAPSFRLLRVLYENGADIVYLTGRHETCREVTLDSLRAANAPLGLLLMRDYPWPEDGSGWARYVDYKAGSLRDVRAVVYVGDNEHDARAAHEAPCEFLDARTWRALSVSLSPVAELASALARIARSAT